MPETCREKQQEKLRHDEGAKRKARETKGTRSNFETSPNMVNQVRKQGKAREREGEGGNARETTQKKVPEKIQSSKARESSG